MYQNVPEAGGAFKLLSEFLLKHVLLPERDAKNSFYIHILELAFSFCLCFLFKRNRESKLIIPDWFKSRSE